MHTKMTVRNRQSPKPWRASCFFGVRQATVPMSLILLTVSLVIWLNQQALMIYWQQRYHTEAPWAAWQGNPVWDFGARLYRAVDFARGTFIDQLFESQPDEKAVPKIPVMRARSAFPQGFLQGSATLKTDRTDLTAEQDDSNAPPLPIFLSPGDRVLFIGDSLMQGGAPHVKHALLTQCGIASLNLSRQSTGLRYPAFFNWPQTLSQTLQDHPDITVVVVFLGPNDPWGLPADEQAPAAKFKSERWEIRYRARIADMLHTAQQHHARVIWLGPPNTRDPTLSQGMQYLRPLFQSEVSQAGEIYLDANAILQNSDTGYRDTLTDPTGSRKMRTADGVHFTPQGQRLLASAIMNQLQGAQADTPLQQTMTHVNTTTETGSIGGQ